MIFGSKPLKSEGVSGCVRLLVLNLQRIGTHNREDAVEIRGGGNPCRARLALRDRFLQGIQLARQVLKLRQFDCVLRRVEERLLRCRDMRHAAGRGEKPDRLLLVRPQGVIDRAFPNGVCFEFGAKVCDGGADLIVVRVVQRDALLGLHISR